MHNLVIKIFDAKKIKRKAFSIQEVAYFFFLLLYIYVIANPISNKLEASIPIITFHELNLYGIINILIIAPVIEEFLFRIHLSGEKKHIWAVFLMIISFVFVFIPDLFLWFLIIILLFGGFFILYYEEFSSIMTGKLFNLLFYVSCILFALMHFHQVDAETIPVKIMVVLIFFFPLGFYFGYIRKSYGLVSSIIAHSLYNLSVLIINSLYYGQFFISCSS